MTQRRRRRHKPFEPSAGVAETLLLAERLCGALDAVPTLGRKPQAGMRGQ